MRIKNQNYMPNDAVLGGHDEDIRVITGGLIVKGEAVG